jgi:hypothetical protein
VTKKTLIIDDDVDSWRLLSTILESHTFILCGLPMECKPSLQPAGVNPAPSS